MSGPDVIVVGAGVSGMAAADAVRLAGRQALVLDASDRVAGRVRTVTYDGDSAEAGGQGIHSNYDEMKTLLASYGLLGDLMPNTERSLYVDQKGRHRVSRIKEDLSLLVGVRGVADLLRFRSKYIVNAIDHPQFELVEDIPEYDNVTADEAFASYSRGFKDFVLRPATQAMANTTPEETNLYYLVNGLKLAMTTEIFSLAGGNQRLLEAMAGKADVRLGAKVGELLMTGERVDGVRLENGEAIKARHVIVTAPARAAGAMLPDHFASQKGFLNSFPYVALPLVFFFLDRPLKSDASRFYGHPFRDASYNMMVNHAVKTKPFAPSGRALLSAWPTYPQTGELEGLGEEALIARAMGDMDLFVPGIAGMVRHATVVRHDWGVARYPVGSAKRILDFKREAEAHRGVSFAGTDYEFLHMEAGIRSGQRAARRALADL